MEMIIIAVLLYIATLVTYQHLRTSTPRRNTKRPLFVDTSVLIDGRIIAVAQSGFLTSPLYIPRSVLGELQLLADGGDSEKRARARHGLDVAKQLQELDGVEAQIFRDSESVPEGVDSRLLTLAKKHRGIVCTIDYNLNKVAQAEGTAVANVNDLAMSLRMAYLPGEKLLLELTQKGNDSHQAIGHLADGTMVVVEHASQMVGKTAEIEFIRSLQTAAGKMMFAKLTQTTVPAQNKKRAVKSKDLQGRKPQPQKRAQEQPQAAVAEPEAPIQQKSPEAVPTPARQPQKQRRQKPLTNEERLVELANK